MVGTARIPGGTSADIQRRLDHWWDIEMAGRRPFYVNKMLTVVDISPVASDCVEDGLLLTLMFSYDNLFIW